VYRAPHAALGARAAEDPPVDLESQQADRAVAILTRRVGCRGREPNPHLAPSELDADSTMAARAELGFFKHDLAVVRILGGEEKCSAFESNVGDLSHRDLLSSSRTGRAPPTTARFCGDCALNDLRSD
jgi:hypothetical protein